MLFYIIFLHCKLYCFIYDQTKLQLFRESGQQNILWETSYFCRILFYPPKRTWFFIQRKSFCYLPRKIAIFLSKKGCYVCPKKPPNPRFLKRKKFIIIRKNNFPKCEAVLFFSYLAFFLYSMGLFQLQGDFYIVCNHILNFWFFSFWYFSRAFFLKPFLAFLIIAGWWILHFFIHEKNFDKKID